MADGNLNTALKVALIERRVLSITYRAKASALEQGVRHIEVYGFDEQYVDAYCRLRQDPRCFRIDRIVDAKVLAEKFSIDPAIESIVAAQGWANRTAAWRRERMRSIQQDEDCDDLALLRPARLHAEEKKAPGCLGLLMAALGLAGG
jgi:predicted DNA-binding transcriptional regulator YafY